MTCESVGEVFVGEGSDEGPVVASLDRLALAFAHDFARDRGGTLVTHVTRVRQLAEEPGFWRGSVTLVEVCYRLGPSA